jgi:hypothetical protein
MTQSAERMLADQLERLCCAETEGKFFDCVTDNIQTIIACLRAASPPAHEGKAWRHKKRGTTYTEVGRGLLQMAYTDSLTDNDLMVVYRDQAGSLWMRAESEFNDGRFEPLLASPSHDSTGAGKRRGNEQTHEPSRNLAGDRLPYKRALGRRRRRLANVFRLSQLRGWSRRWILPT